MMTTEHHHSDCERGADDVGTALSSSSSSSSIIASKLSSSRMELCEIIANLDGGGGGGGGGRGGPVVGYGRVFTIDADGFSALNCAAIAVQRLNSSLKKYYEVLVDFKFELDTAFSSQCSSSSHSVGNGTIDLSIFRDAGKNIFQSFRLLISLLLAFIGMYNSKIERSHQGQGQGSEEEGVGVGSEINNNNW